MNDFLQSLRSGNHKSPRAGMTRRSQDHEFHSMNQRFQYYSDYQGNSSPQSYPAPDYYPGQHVAEDADSNVSSLLLHSIETLSKQVETLTKKQKKLIAAQEKTASVIGRQARAIETIVDNIDRLSISLTAD